MNKRRILLIAAFFSALTAWSEIITSQKFNYSIDFPEGYQITDMEEDESTVIFKNKYLDAHAIIRIWPQSQYKDSKEALTSTLNRLQASSDFSQSIWRRQKCCLATFSSSALLPDSLARGWAAAIPLPQNKGILTILSYSPENVYEDLNQLLVSLIDSILIDAGSYREAGLITGTFYPRNKVKNITLNINGKEIQSQISENDAEASQFVIDREFAVFSFYALNNLPEMYDAWIRFYRLLARDSMERVKKVSFDIYAALRSDCEEKDPENPDAALAQSLLYWAQDFNYERKSSSAKKADIESIPAILEGGSSDCDGRSLLLMCILKNCSIDSCMFISSQYSHAILGVNLPGKMGFSIKVNNGQEDIDYLTGETTAKGLTLGKISADMADPKKWLSVELP